MSHLLTANVKVQDEDHKLPVAAFFSDFRSTFSLHTHPCFHPAKVTVRPVKNFLKNQKQIVTQLYFQPERR